MGEVGRINPVGTAARETQDAEMLKHPDWWPMWPCLHLKRRFDRKDPTKPDFAVVTADYPTILLKNKPTILGIILQLNIEAPSLRAPQPSPDARASYTASVIQRYTSINELVKDWTVD